MEQETHQEIPLVETSKKKSPLLTVGVFLVILIVAGGIFAKVNTKPQETPRPQAQTLPISPSIIPNPNVVVNSIRDSADEPTGTVREMSVNAKDFSFSAKTITVKRGDIVKIIFNNLEGNHDFVLDEYKVKTNILKEGTTEAVQFLADKVGTFEYYCSVGSHKAMGMVGKLTVK